MSKRDPEIDEKLERLIRECEDMIRSVADQPNSPIKTIVINTNLTAIRYAHSLQIARAARYGS